MPYFSFRSERIKSTTSSSVPGIEFTVTSNHEFHFSTTLDKSLIYSEQGDDDASFSLMHCSWFAVIECLWSLRLDCSILTAEDGPNGGMFTKLSLDDPLERRRRITASASSLMEHTTWTLGGKFHGNHPSIAAWLMAGERSSWRSSRTMTKSVGVASTNFSKSCRK